MMRNSSCRFSQASKEFGATVIGRRIDTCCEGNLKWVSGKIKDYCESTKTHTVEYDNGDLTSKSLSSLEALGFIRWLEPRREAQRDGGKRKSIQPQSLKSTFLQGPDRCKSPKDSDTEVVIQRRKTIEMNEVNHGVNVGVKPHVINKYGTTGIGVDSDKELYSGYGLPRLQDSHSLLQNISSSGLVKMQEEACGGDGDDNFQDSKSKKTQTYDGQRAGGEGRPAGHKAGTAEEKEGHEFLGMLVQKEFARLGTFRGRVRKQKSRTYSNICQCIHTNKFDF
jgi:hypothetical protein